MNPEIDLTVYVHFSIPVGLVYDEPPTVERVRRDAIAVLLEHPALQHPAELDGYVDKITATGPGSVMVFEQEEGAE